MSRNYMSLNSPRLINNRAKFRKEWSGRLKNSPKIKFTARSFTTAKDAGLYNVAISCAWRGIPNKVPRSRTPLFHCKIRIQMFASITRHTSLVVNNWLFGGESISPEMLIPCPPLSKNTHAHILLSLFLPYNMAEKGG